MNKLVVFAVFSLNGCFVLGQSSSNEDIVPFRTSVQEFFGQFKGVTVEYDLVQVGESMDVPIMTCSTTLYKNLAIRSVESMEYGGPGGSFHEMNQELLLNPDGFMLQAFRTIEKGSGRVSSATVKMPEKNWKKASAHNLRSVWGGFLWTGDEFDSVFDEEFWKDGQVQKKTNQIIVIINRPNSSFVEFEFDVDNIFQRLTVHVSPKKEPQDFCVFEINTKDSKFTGWKISTLESDETPVAMKVKKMVEATTSGTPLEFQYFKVEDGTEIHVPFGSTIRHEYHRGKMQKVIDEEADKKINIILESKGMVREKGDNRFKTIKLTRYLDSTSNSHCGAYSFSAAAATLGLDVPAASLIEDPRIVNSNGTTISGLRIAAEESGLFAKVYVNANYRVLQNTPAPALLRFGKSHQANGKAHWVTFLGSSADGRIEILDLPGDPRTVEPALLHTVWDGTAVFFSTSKNFSNSVDPRGVVFYLALVAIPLVWTNCFKPCRSFSLIFALLPIYTVVLTLIWFLGSPIGFANNPDAVSLTAAKVGSTNDTGSIELVNELPPSKDNDSVIVDCRLPASYRRSHIPSAVSIPLNCKPFELLEFAKGIDSGQAVFIYCRNRDCDWSLELAKRLSALGLRKLHVYEPGWEGYVQSRIGFNSEQHEY